MNERTSKELTPSASCFELGWLGWLDLVCCSFVLLIYERLDERPTRKENSLKMSSSDDAEEDRHRFLLIVEQVHTSILVRRRKRCMNRKIKAFQKR